MQTEDLKVWEWSSSFPHHVNKQSQLNRHRAITYILFTADCGQIVVHLYSSHVACIHAFWSWLYVCDHDSCRGIYEMVLR